MSKHFSPEQLRHVKYLWDDAHADSLDPVGRLVYRSNLLGADGRITNTGGGNTSSKLIEKDPLSGEDALVMWAHDIDDEAYSDRLHRLWADLPGTTLVEHPR